jgi:hypothetical protein
MIVNLEGEWRTTMSLWYPPAFLGTRARDTFTTGF